MSNIDKQALREKFERWWEVNYHKGNPPRFGWEHWRDGDGYQIDDDESELDGMWGAWQAAHSSKLEAKDKSISFLKDQLAQLANFNPDWDKLEAATDSLREHMVELTAARNRIAELEAQRAVVTLPTGYSVRPGHPINETERSVMIPKDGGQWLSRFDVEHALRVAGIRINGEG